MVRYRDALVTEAAAHALLAEYFDSRRESFPASQGEYRTVFPDPAKFVAPDGAFVVVESDPEGDVGCGGIRRHDDHTFEVKHVWIQPRMRGEGLGKRLLTELERRAAELGATRIVLDTNEAQVAAASLYRSTGYVEIEPYNDNANATNWFEKNLS